MEGDVGRACDGRQTGREVCVEPVMGDRHGGRCGWSL